MAGRPTRNGKSGESAAAEADSDALLADLHLAYKAGELRVLVGAGLSFDSGLPGWDVLNERLLLEHLRERYGRFALVSQTQLADAAKRLYTHVGRDGSADLVRRLSGMRFGPLLARALYGHRGPADHLAVRSAHLALGAMAWERAGEDFLHTTNFDPLLEMGLASKPVTRERRDWREHRRDGRRSRSIPQVAHLHGWVDPAGESSGAVVLTESDYLDLAAHRGPPSINRQWQRLIDRDGALLVLGMSLNDPNLRRFLHNRRSHPRAHSLICSVFESADRHTNEYLHRYWVDGWGINKLNVAQQGTIPTLLRDIAFGPGRQPTRELPWLAAARRWVTAGRGPGRMFSESWQEAAHSGLATMVQRMRTSFQLQDEERLSASLFLPVAVDGSATITRVATSSEMLPTGRAGLEQMLRTRSLSVARAAPQGAAGISFVEGFPVSGHFGSNKIDFGFGDEMRWTWYGQDPYRSWRSIYAVPVLDTPHWISVAVVCLMSSFSEPFWVRFPDERRELYLTELKNHCRKTAARFIKQLREPS